MTDESPATRCGFIALLGAPNAGKSTLMNRLMGTKVSIVTPKVQTTRTRVVAIAIEGDSQLVFIDTPGIFKPKRRLERAMVEAAWGGAADADLIVLLVDAARGRDAETDGIIEGLKQAERKAILALNKIDLVARPNLLGLAKSLNDEGIFSDVFMISALDGDGVDDLKRHLAAAVPEGPWLYPEDQLATMPERLLAAEITREQLFLQLRQELPYSLTVETDKWEDRKDGSARIDQTIYVERESQRAIVLGKGGSMIKRIGQLARAEMTRVFQRPIHLFLFVKVREGWTDDPERYRAMGLDYPR